MSTVLAMNDQWLNDTTTVSAQQTGHTVDYQQLTIGGPYNWPYNWPYLQGWTYPVYIQSPSRPIKLTLSEVDRLRKAAKADAKLKEVLIKFTGQIEIVMDLE